MESRELELLMEIRALKERVNNLVLYLTESLTAVDVRLAKLEKEFEHVGQATTE